MARGRAQPDAVAPPSTDSVTDVRAVVDLLRLCFVENSPSRDCVADVSAVVVVVSVIFVETSGVGSPSSRVVVHERRRMRGYADRDHDVNAGPSRI